MAKTYSRMNIMPSKLSISSFDTITLSTQEFRWLNQNHWSNNEKEAFLKQYKTFNSNLYRQPVKLAPNESLRQNAIKSSLNRWAFSLLSDDKNKPLGFCELQIFHNCYTTGFVFISFQREAETANLQEALALIISATFLINQCDVIDLCCLPSSAFTLEMVNPNWGDLRSIHSPAKPINIISNEGDIKEVKLITIKRSSWWKHEDAKSARKKLAYVENRLNHEAQMAQLKRSPQKRRGILSRLFQFGPRK
jgi:hypothetical protein